MGSHKVGRLLIRALLWSVMLLGHSSSAWATVYGWQGDGGVLHLSNDPADVPEGQRNTAQQFTSKFAKLAGAPAAAAPPESASLAGTEISPTNLQLSAYEHGLAQGLQAGERQVELAGQLAQMIFAAAPRTQPPSVIIQQPGPVIIHSVTPEYYSPFFSHYPGPYFPGPWAFGGFFPLYRFPRHRFIPHSHFFPGARNRGAEVFFPSGHFSHHGFLFGPQFRRW